MHLVAPLVGGVVGAENGHAELYQRGTSTRAIYYLDFEGEVLVTTGADVALDAHGGAVLYVTELVLVVVKDVGGAVLRSFVAGDAAPAVEVISQSFSGTSYDGAASGPGEPTTLASVLDRWLLQTGGSDWNVTIPGAVDPPGISIGDALAGSYGLVFNVRAFGALGDGVSFDTNAINEAITQAQVVNGGIVYFPPGTYRTTGNHQAACSVLGAGPSASRVVSSSGVVLFNCNPPAKGFQTFAGLHLSSEVVGADALVRPNGTRLVMSNMVLDAGTLGGYGVRIGGNTTFELLCDNCIFLLGSNGYAYSSVSLAAVRHALFRDCRFITPASYALGAVVVGRNIWFEQCVFENDACTTGTYDCIQSSTTQMLARVRGCEFTASGGATVTAMGLGSYASNSYFDEIDNSFGVGITAYGYTVPNARGAQVTLRSRESRSIFITDNTTAPILPLDQYGLVTLSNNAATNFTWQASKVPPEGARGSVVLYRPTGSAAVNAAAGSVCLSPVAIAVVATGTYTWEYRAVIPNATVRLTLVVDGKNNGTGA